MKTEFVNPPGVSTPVGFTQGVKVTGSGTLIFVSGQTGSDEKGNVVAVGDLEKQTRQAMKNIGKVLDSLGATYKDIVSLTIYTTRIGDMSIVRQVRSEFLDKHKPPAITSVGVAQLGPDRLIEIQATAALK